MPRTEMICDNDDENRPSIIEVMYQDDFGNWQGYHSQLQYDRLDRL